MGFEQIKKETESLQPKHLKEGVKPIVACVGSYHENINQDKKENAKDIDYFSNKKDLDSNNFKNAGELTYVISEIDDRDKFSSSFRNCTGVVVSGIDKETSKNISFLSHQHPGSFLYSSEGNAQFRVDLDSQIKKLKDRCLPASIDSVIFGGNYIQNSSKHEKSYLESIKFLSSRIKNALDFVPIVITGPKIFSSAEDVFFDNKNKRLYISRPGVGNKSTEPYNPDSIKDKEQEWKSEI
jgi:hypothetical protein